MPEAEQQVINQIADVLEQATPDAPVDSLNESMQGIFAEVASNPELNQSTACLAASVAWRSSQFWSEVTIANTGAKFPSIGQLIHVIGADIGGAIAGAGLGYSYAGVNYPGDVNAANNSAIVGAVIGAAAASAAEWPSGDKP